ncbi:hypothetical protein FXO37_12374 [Capsicum annuum]|nr:hypothetical protein FXO37_12374 [Capsicum annuum]
MRMFLDIACLYNRRPRHDVEWIFKSCGIHLIGINRLIEKSLLSTRDASSFCMHNLIREMGENVSRERQYASSRIWLNEEVHDLFAGKLKTKKVESLRIPKGYRFEEDHVNHSKVFKRMQSLQVLMIKLFAQKALSLIFLLACGELNGRTILQVHHRRGLNHHILLALDYLEVDLLNFGQYQRKRTSECDEVATTFSQNMYPVRLPAKGLFSHFFS